MVSDENCKGRLGFSYRGHIYGVLQMTKSNVVVSAENCKDRLGLSYRGHTYRY